MWEYGHRGGCVTSEVNAKMDGDSFGNGTAQLDKKKKMQQGFQRSFVQVQSILDQNRLLIDEISQNQESKVPAGLSRNVGLIRDLNNNFHRVLNLYADLSTNFSTDSSKGGSTGSKPDEPA